MLLGVGFDARAARLPFANVTYFELDFDASMKAKLKAIDEIADYPKQCAKYVTHDLENAKISFVERYANYLQHNNSLA